MFGLKLLLNKKKSDPGRAGGLQRRQSAKRTHGRQRTRGEET